jgi:molybdopterin/thiamine biosynthesis adenylyltransferase|tara:strand:+ start:873 stop:1640 length:768 start_codon:yes stop_codon:yes gene_type:complete
MLAKKTKANLTDKQLLRYNRHIVLPEIDIDGQALLVNSKVVIIGLGGLGCPAATYLASSGLSNLLLIDDDLVSLSNLNRQTLFTEKDLDKHKVEAASKRLIQLNSDLIIKTDKTKINQYFDMDKLKEYDVIIDCTDNFETRTLINQISILHRIPLITGAALKFEGQVAVFRNDIENEPCYRCLYPDLPKTKNTCIESGILGSVTGFVGTILATECIKLLCKFGKTFESKLFLIDLKNNDFKIIKINKDNQCEHCK